MQLSYLLYKACTTTQSASAVYQNTSGIYKLNKIKEDYKNVIPLSLNRI